jgi:hypothetical protein
MTERTGGAIHDPRAGTDAAGRGRVLPTENVCRLVGTCDCVVMETPTASARSWHSRAGDDSVEAGPSFVVIGSVVCSISITGGRVHRSGSNNGTERRL